MITKQHLFTIYNILLNDESFCRLSYYGENPMDVDLDDISTSEDKEKKMKEVIWFSPQIEDLTNSEQSRILIYKSFTKLKNTSSVVRDELIRIDLFVPHRFVRDDFRIYDLENTISRLLDDEYIRGLGNLSYTDGRFLDSPVTGFALYRMVFSTKQGRDVDE
jgi:hypothetical protein